MVGGELDGAHGALGVEQRGALGPPCAARACTRAVGKRGIGVGGGGLLPDLDGAVEGGGGEDGAELGMRPAHFGDGRIMRLQRTSSRGGVQGTSLRSERRARG